MTTEDPSGRETPDTTVGEGMLAGVRILDLTRVLAGPFCTQVLGDLGADVIKVEEPTSGDEVRNIAPDYPGEVSHYFLSLNRNKRSIAVDLKTEEGRQIVLDLAATSDVVVENFRPGVMERLGLGLEDLQRSRPDIILCSISGFGQDGPQRDAPAFDLVTQAMSGLMSVTGEVGSPPSKSSLPLGDLGGGMWAVIAIQAALLRRAQTGRGHRIDVSLLDGLIAMQGYLNQLALLTGAAPEQVGSNHHSVTPYGRFRVEDGYLVIAILVERFWTNLCIAVGLETLADDARFATNERRHQHRAELTAILEERLAEGSRAEWSERLAAHDVPHAPVLNIVEALQQDQVVERGLLRTMVHPMAGDVVVVGPPIQVDSRRTGGIMRPAPLLGEHTRELLLQETGRSEEDVAHLLSGGVVREPASFPDVEAPEGERQT